MKRPDKIEWFLRLATFGSAVAVGVIEAWNIWASSRDLSALSIFILVFAVIFASLAYIVKKRRLRMLQT
jgi:uncharacterized membrane protein